MYFMNLKKQTLIANAIACLFLAVIYADAQSQFFTQQALAVQLKATEHSPRQPARAKPRSLSMRPKPAGRTRDKNRRASLVVSGRANTLFEITRLPRLSQGF